MNTTVFIETERLILRSWEETDYEPYIQMNKDPLVRRYFPNLLSTEQSLASIAVNIKNMMAYGYGLFATALKDSGEFIGFIGFAHPGFDSYFTPCVEIGWRLRKPFWGRGLATEGAKACLREGAARWGLSTVYSFTSIHNQASEKVMIRIGMERQGKFLHPSIPVDNWLCEHVLYKSVF